VTYFTFIHLIKVAKLFNNIANHISTVMNTTFKSRCVHEVFSGVISLLLEMCS